MAKFLMGRLFLCLVVQLLFGQVAYAAGSCPGHVKTQQQLLDEWQTCAAQSLPAGCLTQSTVTDIICSVATPVNDTAFGGQLSVTSVALTDGTTITVPAHGSTFYALTLTGGTPASPHKMSCPTNLLGVQFLTFDITQGTGGGATGYPLAWDDTCYQFPNFAPPTLTADTGGVDSVTCYSIDASHLRCGAAQTAIGSGFLIRSNHNKATCTSSTTCSVVLANSQTGDLRILGLRWGLTGASNPVAGDITNITDEHGNSVCSHLTNTFHTIPAGTRATDIWDCPVSTGAASSTVTVTFAGSEQFSEIMAVEVLGAAASPDAGLGNGASGTSTSLSAAATGAVTQNNSLVFSMMKAEGGTTQTLTAGRTQLDQDNVGSPDMDEYQLTSSGTPSNTATLVGAALPWSTSIAVFKHK
jgi:hypothetical protein